MHLENVEIVHFIPGRVRLRAAELRGQMELAERIKKSLSDVPGISKVDVNAITGSVLILYDGTKLARPDSGQALRGVMETFFPSLDIDVVLSWLAKAHQ